MKHRGGGGVMGGGGNSGGGEGAMGGVLWLHGALTA